MSFPPSAVVLNPQGLPTDLPIRVRATGTFPVARWGTLPAWHPAELVWPESEVQDRSPSVFEQLLDEGSGFEDLLEDVASLDFSTEAETLELEGLHLEPVAEESPRELWLRQQRNVRMREAARGCENWPDARLVEFLVEWTPELEPEIERGLIAMTLKEHCASLGPTKGHRVWRRRLEEIALGNGFSARSSEECECAARRSASARRASGNARRRRAAQEALRRLAAAGEAADIHGSGIGGRPWLAACLAVGFPVERFRRALRQLRSEELIEPAGGRRWRLTPAGARELARLTA